jgi:uncharacterized protein YjbI with pentapeptide repeats
VPPDLLTQAEFDQLHAEHLRWYERRGGDGPMDLYGRSLRGLDLRGRCLDGAELIEVDLADCDLSGVDVTHAALMGANLRGARVRDSRMDAAGFDETLVGGADFTGSTGTVGPGATVLLDKDGSPVDAVAALNDAGARVTEYQPEGE